MLNTYYNNEFTTDHFYIIRFEEEEILLTDTTNHSPSDSPSLMQVQLVIYLQLISQKKNKQHKHFPAKMKVKKILFMTVVFLQISLMVRDRDFHNLWAFFGR